MTNPERAWTAGEWKARKQPDTPDAWYVAAVGEDEQGRRLTSFPALCEIHKGPNKANARLISAAPDMFEALADLVENKCSEHCDWEAARNALSKASGTEMKDEKS